MLRDTTNYPNLQTAERLLGSATWTTPPNPTAVWKAEIHGELDGFSVCFSAVGPSEVDALCRLDAALAAFATLAAEAAHLLDSGGAS